MKMTSLLFKGLGMKTLNLSLAATFMLKRLFNAQLVHKRRLCCLISWHLAHINGPLLLLGRTKFTIKLSGAVLCYCCARGFYLNTGPLALGIGYLRPVSMGFHQSFMDINYADVALYL
jgi:hypothetical protein